MHDIERDGLSDSGHMATSTLYSHQHNILVNIKDIHEGEGGYNSLSCIVHGKLLRIVNCYDDTDSSAMCADQSSTRCFVLIVKKLRATKWGRVGGDGHVF